MSTNLMTASSEYASRPKDEIYPSYKAFVAACVYDRDHSAERNYNLRDLHAVPDASGRSIMLESPKGQAKFTHWSFGQLVRSITPPGVRGVAGYLASLPADLAAKNLNYGLRDAAHTAGQRANLLIKANGGTPIVRAATSDTYGRAWSADLHSVGERYFGDGCKSSQGEWQSPPTWDGQPAGQYRGDRDDFVIRIDGGSIVGDPRGFGAIGGGSGQLNRAIMVRNSEVGASSISLDLILFDKICGNHILWGAVIDSTFKRRHVGADVAAKAITEILRIARKYNDRAASQDDQIIKHLAQYEIASTREAVIDELTKLGYSKTDATEAYATCEAKEPHLNPRSFWGIAAGTTRNSQDSGYQDDRLALDQLAASVLRKGRVLVTV